jgi:hypothetical protein
VAAPKVEDPSARGIGTGSIVPVIPGTSRNFPDFAILLGNFRLHPGYEIVGVDEQKLKRKFET